MSLLTSRLIVLGGIIPVLAVDDDDDEPTFDIKVLAVLDELDEDDDEDETLLLITEVGRNVSLLFLMKLST